MQPWEFDRRERGNGVPSVIFDTLLSGVAGADRQIAHAEMKDVCSPILKNEPIAIRPSASMEIAAITVHQAGLCPAQANEVNFFPIS